MNVFDVLRKKLKESANVDIGHHFSVEHNVAIRTVDAIEIVNQVEQEYNNGWIPCSERLPEYTDEYNVTVGVASIGGYYEKVTTLRYERIKGKEPKWIKPDNAVYVVIAWQPLPPKYEPKGE